MAWVTLSDDHGDPSHPAYAVDTDAKSALVTIFDDDLPTVQITSAPPTANPSAYERGCIAGSFCVKLSGAVDHQLVVSYTIGGSADIAQAASPSRNPVTKAIYREVSTELRKNGIKVERSR